MARVRSPAIIDVEASGFGIDSYPIEIGLILPDGVKFCTLVKPSKEWNHWDDSAQAIHGVSQKTLATFGKPVEEVAETLNELLHGRVLYSDGWVVDKPWLSKLFYQAGCEMQFSVSPLEMILNEPQMEIWHAVKEQVVADFALKRHRASNDALVIQETYKRTQSIVEQHLAQSAKSQTSQKQQNPQTPRVS